MKRSAHSWLRKLGFGGVAAGMVLAVTGIVSSPVSAAPGNNGNIKVDEQGLENGPGAPNSNDPHIDCTGRIEWYGFDDGAQQSDVIFEVQAPTSNTAGPGADASKTYTRVAIPNGNGAGGTTLDGTLDFDLSDLLAAYEAHPKQGYHVKVTAHTTTSQGNDVKHKVFWVQPCEGEEIGGLTIEKAVDGNDLPAAGTEFEFTVACTSEGQPVDMNGADPGNTATFVLTAGGPAEAFPLLPAGATCTVTETDDQDADRTSWVVDGGAPTPGDTDSVDVTIADATTVAVVATNVFNTTTPPPPPPGPTFGAFSLNKDVTGDDAPDPDTEFTFDVTCSNGLDQDVVLTAGEDANVFGNLPTGTTCTIVETDDADATGTTWTGGTPIQGQNGVSLTIGNGTTLTVTALNAFQPAVQPTPPPEVLPEVITPERPVAPERPVTPKVRPTAGQQPTQVQGNVVTRPAQLPRTGNDALPLVEVGLGMVLLGAGAVLFGRERTAII